MKSLKYCYVPVPAFQGYGDKGTTHSYIDVYEQLLYPYQEPTSNILEIGVAYGNSIEMFSKYFATSTVWGVDIEITRSAHVSQLHNVQLLDGDATKPEILEKLPKHFSVIIDDGSNVQSDQIASFHLLWPRLQKGGIYIIEDIHNIDSFREHLKTDELMRSVTGLLIDLRYKKSNIDDDVLFVAYK